MLLLKRAVPLLPLVTATCLLSPLFISERTLAYLFYSMGNAPIFIYYIAQIVSALAIVSSAG